MPEGGGVGTQLVSRHPLRREALLAEQLAHEPDSCALVSSALNQDLEDLALMIDGTPQIHVLARNPDDHFVEMPSIARWRRHRRRARAIAGPNLSTQLRTLS